MEELLRQIVTGTGDPALLDNLEVLFEPELQIDPLALLQSLSRDRTVVASWPGTIFAGQLYYAEPGLPEHRRYPVAELVVVALDLSTGERNELKALAADYRERLMTKAFDKIMAGLEDARAYRGGKRAGFAIYEVEVSSPDVIAIRSKTGLSQPAFARSIGIALGTLKNWEQGRRRPEGPARVLLALIDKRPSIVQEELGR